MNPPSPTTPVPHPRGAPAQGGAEAALQEATALFNRGRLAASRALLNAAPLAALPRAARAARQTLFFALAAYGHASRAELLAEHAQTPRALRPDLRYRALLAHRLWAEAGRYRRAMAAQAGPDIQADWHFSAALRLLWQGKTTRGLRLYRHRLRATNGLKTFAARLRHVPRAVEPLENIVLEQGLGDICLHLAHLRALTPPGARLCFLGAPRWRPLVALAFPGARFRALRGDGAEGRPLVNASADVLEMALARGGTLQLQAPLFAPWRRGPARLGILWRAGSAQNHRDEREIGLEALLATLPPDCEIVPLQHDATPEETARLARDPRVRTPGIDLRADLVGLVDLVRGLAGVLGVDGSALHLAGVCGVPALVLINPTAHWYWGRPVDGKALYPQAEMLPLADLAKAPVAAWWARATTRFASRPAAPALISGDHFARPVFITGIPRSGTSMVAGLLGEAGLWLGQTVPASPENPRGFFENTRIRERIIKPLLSDFLGADPLGVRSLPEPGALPLFAQLPRAIARALRDEGYGGAEPWGYKDAKLTLLWPAFAEAFPQAQWVILRRERAETVASLARTSFMAQHTRDPAFWHAFCDAYEARLDALTRDRRGAVRELAFEELRAGRLGALKALVGALGLEWNGKRARAFLL